MRSMIVAAALAVASCTGSATVSQSPSPAATPSIEQSPSPSASPSPAPLQRREPSLPAAVEETAAAAAGGRLYVLGGFNAAGQSLSTVYVFDGTRWSAGPRLPLPLDHSSAATLADHVYIAGGHSNGADSARLFRLDGNRWTELARMHFARGGHALLESGGKLFVLGGNSALGNIAAVEEYDPATNRWKTVASLPQPRNHVIGFVGGGALCVAGGRSPTTTRVDCLEPVAHAWSRVSNLPLATSGGGAIAFDDGTIVLAGGENAQESRIVDQLVFSKPQGWASAGRMLVPRHGFQLALFNGRAWACGGGNAAGLHPVATCTSLGDPAAPEN